MMAGSAARRDVMASFIMADTNPKKMAAPSSPPSVVGLLSRPFSRHCQHRFLQRLERLRRENSRPLAPSFLGDTLLLSVSDTGAPMEPFHFYQTSKRRNI
ncbi:hypothetical protein HPB47_000026 [Ixodes persulcatus]|uniref:Uncharacterized protein n=1 Tax=Ixodes persulcatus TaxID=34615 RepID=A0AC60PTA0_IXOPE|nr:hypothetical protein HPB47_000026 [Ixodes persulcatus]